MGEVVQLRPNAADAMWSGWVRCVCHLAGADDRADQYLARGTSRARIVAELRTLNPSLRQGEQALAYLHSMQGPAGTARAALPLHPEPHGLRRRPSPRK
jgi:hypothetical protein